MTRDEEIILKVCKHYLQRYFNIDIAGLSIEEVDGVNVWHDVSENPTEDTLILYRTTSGKYGTTELVCTSEGVWHLFVKDYEVAEWAYISDLLPKQFGKSKQVKGGKNE